MPVVEALPAEQLVPPTVESEPLPEGESVPTLEAETNQAGSGYQPQDVAQPQDEAELQQHVDEIVPLPEEDKLSHLKLIAKDKGLEKAIAVVKKMDDPWLEDKFHDDLMDDAELRSELEVLGKIEKL